MFCAACCVAREVTCSAVRMTVRCVCWNSLVPAFVLEPNFESLVTALTSSILACVAWAPICCAERFDFWNALVPSIAGSMFCAACCVARDALCSPVRTTVRCVCWNSLVPAFVLEPNFESPVTALTSFILACVAWPPS